MSEIFFRWEVVVACSENVFPSKPRGTETTTETAVRWLCLLELEYKSGQCREDVSLGVEERKDNWDIDGSVGEIGQSNFTTYNV
jgi:hypothetical protein